MALKTLFQNFVSCPLLPLPIPKSTRSKPKSFILASVACPDGSQMCMFHFADQAKTER